MSTNEGLPEDGYDGQAYDDALVGDWLEQNHPDPAPGTLDVSRSPLSPSPTEFTPHL